MIAHCGVYIQLWISRCLSRLLLIIHDAAENCLSDLSLFSPAPIKSDSSVNIYSTSWRDSYIDKEIFRSLDQDKTSLEGQ